MMRVHKIISKLSKSNQCAFSSAMSKRSYYDILQLNSNFSSKQLRNKFLEKARKYHPDHNKSQQAAQQFKLLKQAYQTLKDPQRKHMYDSGVAQTSEEVAPVHNQQVKIGKKYYENKWYGYQKPKAEDMRDEYYRAKAEYFYQKPTNPMKYIFTFTFITIALFGYDFLSNVETAKSKKMEESRRIIENSISSDKKQTKRQILLQKYIDKRAQVNKIDL